MSRPTRIPATISDSTKDKEPLVPTRIVVDDDAFDRLVELVTRPPAPTQALRELMRGQDD